MYTSRSVYNLVVVSFIMHYFRRSSSAARV